MYEYIKIPNVFKREQYGNNKIIQGKYSTPELEYLKDCQWIWTEKVDGTNIRVIWDGYRVSFKGRTDKADIPTHLAKKLDELFGGELKEEIFEEHFGNKTVVLYGEGYGEKIQNGGAYGPVDFILFDVWIDGFWLETNNIVEISSYFGVKTVPLIGVGTLLEAIDYIRTHPKSLLKDDTMEGIVAKPKCELFNKKGERVIVKIKCRDFDAEDYW